MGLGASYFPFQRTLGLGISVLVVFADTGLPGGDAIAELSG